MKKVYSTLLVAALGASSMFAQEPKFTTVWTKAYDVKVGQFDPEAPSWKTPDAIKQAPGMRNAVGVNGKLYGVDMKTMSLTAFDENGVHAKAIALPSLEGQTVTYCSLNEAGEATTGPDFYGSLITRDNVGHILVGHAQGTGACNNYWTIVDPATGATKHVSYNDAANIRAYLPINMVGRAVGDVTKEGYLYMAPTSIFWPTIKNLSWGSDHPFIQRTKMMNFTGDGTVAGANVGVQLSGHFPLANWQLTTCAPWFNTVEEMKAAMTSDPTHYTLGQTFFVYSRLQGATGGEWDFNCGIIDPLVAYRLNYPGAQIAGGDGFIYEEGGLASSAPELLLQNHALYEGFDTFTLGGKRYYVASYNEELALKGEGVVSFAVFDEEGYIYYDGEADEDMCYFEYEGEWSDEGEQEGNQVVPVGSMNINIEYVDDENVNIYVWAQCEENGVFAGMFNFGNGNTGLSGVNEVAVDSNDAAPVYYNLNGIQVANPANGIFIEKRGNKVTKVIK